MVKEKRGREIQQASERERERERRSARVSSVAFKRLSRPFWLFSEHRPHRKEREREREREDRTRKRGGERLCPHPLSRMISKMFNNTNPEKWKKFFSRHKVARLLPSIRELGPSQRSRSRPRTRVSVDLPPLVVVVVVRFCVFEESVVWSRYKSPSLFSMMRVLL